MATFELLKGTRPLLISMPHQGTELCEAMMGQVTPIAKTLADTDWHLKELYDFARHMGASLIWPHYSRYVIDLNRPADNSNLYPGANSTAPVVPRNTHFSPVTCSQLPSRRPTTGTLLSSRYSLNRCSRVSPL